MVFAISCSKKYQSPNFVTWSQFNFNVDTLKDIPVKQGQSKSIEIPVNLVSGNTEEVTLSLEDVPTGIHCSLSTLSGTPPFRVSINATTDGNVPINTYPVKLVAKSNTSGTKVYPFNIFVCDINDCACDLAGYYRQISWHSVGWIDTNLATLMPNPLEPGHASISNFSGLTIPALDAYLDCDYHSFIIPKHTNTGDYMIWGSGSFTDSTISLSFHTTMDTIQAYSTFSRLNY